MIVAPRVCIASRKNMCFCSQTVQNKQTKDTWIKHVRQANAQALPYSEVASKRRYTEKGACSKFQTIIFMIYICAMVKSRV